MPSPSLTDLTTPLTLDEVRTSIYSVLGLTGVNTTTWKPGSVVRTIITACSLVIAAVSNLVALIAASGFVTLSAGPWLALVALYVFGVQKITATFAAGVVTVSNTGGGVYGPFAPGAVTFASTVSGKTYQNTGTFSIAALQTGIAVNVSAVESGSASTANAGDITQLVSPALTGVICTNANAIIGTDDELDPDLQLRCGDKLGSLSPDGPPQAYAFVARSAGRDVNGNPVIITPSTPGTSVGVNRVRPVKDGIGGVDVYLATATGGITGTPDDLTSDLGVVDDLLQRFAAPLTVTCRTWSATPVAVPVSYEIWLYQTSLTDAQILAAVNAALVAFFPTRPIGGDQVSGIGAVWASALEAIVGGVSAAPGQPLGIFRTSISLPTGDVVLGASQVPVLGTVTATGIHRVDRGGV